MSLIINDKKVAGLYKAYVIQNATNTASGIIRIATEEEVKAGLDSLTAVTPKQLATKQDVLIAGNGLEILEDGTINNTQTSAEWGNIIGNILDQEDLNAILLTKANEEETAYELIYENSILTLKNRKGDTLSEVSINELPDVDDITIVINEENKLQSIGEKTKSGTFKYTWIGTESEYTDAKDLGIIDEFTECIIIDSEAEKVVPIVQYEAPTKLSQLANDIEFVTNDELQSVKTSLEEKIDLQTDGAEIVHKVGNETIDGFKNFKQKIVIENGLGKGRIAHKPTDTSLEDGYIEFGEDILLYGKQNINGELYDEKHNIFHDGNLIAGDNITITDEDGIYKINSGALNSANIDLSNLGAEGEAKLNNLVADKATINLDNLSEEGNNKFNAKADKASTLEGYGITDGLNKTGDTMTGSLTVDTAYGLPIILKGMGLDVSTNPSSDKNYGIELQDVNGIRVGRLEGKHTTNGTIRLSLNASKNINGTMKYIDFAVGLNANGEAFFSHPQITQSYISGTSGYIVFSNKLSIQWGKFVNSSGGNLTQNTITFLKPFANANYMIQRTNIGVTGDGAATVYTTIKSQTASNFVAITTTTATTTTFSWLAIGYIA